MRNCPLSMHGPGWGSNCSPIGAHNADYSVLPVDAFGEVVVDECANVAKKKQCKKLNGCKWKKALCKAK